MLKILIYLELATEYRLARATVTVNDASESQVWIRQSLGWTTQTGYPAAKEFSAYLDYVLNAKEEGGE